MGIIRQLPQAIINQIAAGEVVERPASVVKELLENAIDARATRIDLSVERGGKDLIRVADNGLGMTAEDLLLAFEPHATSKLAHADDLFRIKTLGFRGEALAAISEVARVRCQTRQAADSEGSELLIEFGIFGPIKKCGGSPGTVMEVRNLFQNTPVRRTFLKSDMTESGHVADMFARIALAHPEVHLTYRSGSKVIYDLPPAPGTRERIATFFGRELAESLLWVEGQSGDMQLWGYVGHPSQSRSSAKGQFLFIAGRYVRDRSLSHALNEAYRGLLMVGRMPVAFLHLEIPADQVDVNVHPTKVEVRFRDSHRVYSHLLSTLRQTFLQSDLHSRLQSNHDTAGAESPPVFAGAAGSAPLEKGSAARGEFAAGGSPAAFDLAGGTADRQTVASWFEPTRGGPVLPESFGQPTPPPWAQSLPLGFPVGPADAFDEFSAGTIKSAEIAADGSSPYGPPAMDADGSRPAAGVQTGPDGAGDRVVNHGGSPPLPPSPSIPPGASLHKAIQVHDSYLIAETGDGMMVIDQHALHERILYEELRPGRSGTCRVAEAPGSGAGGHDGRRGGGPGRAKRSPLAARTRA